MELERKRNGSLLLVSFWSGQIEITHFKGQSKVVK